ncbi:zinc finger BED domain-containing protein [Salix suchowensis]|nr:zinc finger BED domain-containing protein [Salix suchowensis]
MNQACASAEIADILDEICHAHYLPLALTWVSSYSLINNKRILNILNSACRVNDSGVQEFFKACKGHHLEEGQGAAGKALTLPHHCYVPNVCLLDVADYPFVDDARSSGLRAAFAIKLIIKERFYVSPVDTVVEFFLPANLEDFEEKKLMDGILANLRKCCENSNTVRADGYSIQPVHLVGSLNLNQMSLEWNHENSSDASFSDGNNFQLVDVSGSSLRHSEQEVGEQNAAVEPALNVNDKLVVVNGSQTTNGNVKRRRISEVWTAFDKVQENDFVWAICRICKKRYPGESRKGTSNLHKHMRKCFSDRARDTGQQSSSFVERSNLMSSMIGSNCTFNQERSRMDIARMVIKHGYPLNIVEHEFFEIFVSNLQPMFEFYSQDIVEGDVLAVYREEKEKLCKSLDNLSCLFSLTIDLQSYEDRKVTYCCLTLHFIDDGWQLKKKILAFKNLDYNCSTGNLYEVIKSVLLEWNIDKNVQFISTNLIPPNEQMVGELKSKLLDEVLPHSGDLFYTSCHAQVLSLLVQDGFDEIRGVLYKIRHSIEYFNATPIKRQNFCEVINRLKVQGSAMISQDVPTRWETTFLMLERALELREVFSHLEQVDGDYTVKLSTVEWDMATVICECLKVFYKSICNFSTSLVAYFENICLIYKNLHKWEKSEHMYIQSMANRMKVKFCEYWSENRLSFGMLAVLDPRYKYDLVEYGYEQIYNNDAELHLWKFRRDLKLVYSKYASGSNSLESSAPTTADVSCSSYNPNSGDKLCGFKQWQKRKYDSNTGDSQKSELDRYFQEPSVNLGMGSGILGWWRANALKFPTLEKMARDFLAIPISVILSKSNFIDEIMKMNPAINGLNPEIVEALVCGQDWLESPKRRLTRSEDVVLEIEGNQTHHCHPNLHPHPHMLDHNQAAQINSEEHQSFL